MTVLVTGSAGHLGEALVRSLGGLGTRVRGLDLLPGPFVSHVGSIADPGLVAEAMAGVRTVLHAATLHKPHVRTHSRRAFVDTNVTGTLVLLEAAVAAGVRAFVQTSTTSVFGDALRPPAGEPAAWVTEETRPIARNIYGVTKAAAEDLAEIVHKTHGLPVVVLRTSRFFPEEDDDPERRAAFADANVKLNEYLYRRVDIEDVVSAHLLAAELAPRLGFGRYIVSASTPFEPADLAALRGAAAAVVEQRVPGHAAFYAAMGWRMQPDIERVYVNDLARAELGWRPKHDFAGVLARLRQGGDLLSPLARLVGSKGYHAERFADGPYPV